MQTATVRFVRKVSLFATLMLLVAQPGSVFAQEPTISGIQGNTYTSPTFGYSFEWDDAIWSAEEEISDSGYDFIYLASDGAELYVEGLYFYRGDPDDCLDGERLAIADDAGLDDLAPLTDNDGEEVEESGDGYTFGIYELPDSDHVDAGLDSYLYLECQTLVPDSVVLVIAGFLDPDDLEAQESALYDVLQTLELGVVEEDSFDSGDLEQKMRQAGIDINTYWKSVFSDLGENYVNPTFITFTGPVETDCGDATAGETGPFYCPSDQTVYLDIDMLNDEILPFGVVVVQVVLAHEIAHHVQELLGLTGCSQSECGIDGSSLAIELQADCLAGAWTQDAASRDFIQKGDLKRVDLAVKTYLGDPPDTPNDDPEAHGSGEVRAELYRAGFTDGLPACGLE